MSVFYTFLFFSDSQIIRNNYSISHKSHPIFLVLSLCRLKLQIYRSFILEYLNIREYFVLMFLWLSSII